MSKPNADATADVPIEHEEQIPTGTIFNDSFEIVGVASQSYHATTYDIRRVSGETASCQTRYAARAFDLRNLSPPDKRYRTRCMKRLEGRTALRCVWGELHVIIYELDPVHDTAGPALSPNVPSSAKKPVPKQRSKKQAARPKTAYEQESQRLRQRDRRLARKQHKTSDGPDGGSPPTGDGGAQGQSRHLLAKDNTMLTLVRVAHTPQLDPKKVLARPAVPVVERYIAKKDEKMEFKDEDEIAEFMAIKERETAFLKRQHQKLKEELKPLHANLTALVKERNSLGPMSSAGIDFQRDTVEPAKQEYFALSKGLGFLPKLVKANQEMLRDLDQRLKSQKKLKADQDRQQELQARREKLQRQWDNYNDWMSRVVPASNVYEQLYEKLQGVEIEIESTT